MEFGSEKYAIMIMKRGKREVTEETELPKLWKESEYLEIRIIISN